MKRLFYATETLDDAESISNEVHALGVDDSHFYVVYDDEKGIQSHNLHGGSTFKLNEILASRKRSSGIALIAAVAFLVIASLITNLTVMGIASVAVATCVVFFAVKYLVAVSGRSFDVYFKKVFQKYIDRGDAILVIDVEDSESERIESHLKSHPHAKFIADGSNLASPIPD